MMRFALPGIAMLLGLGVAAVAADAPFEARHAVEAADLGVDASLRYTLSPSAHPGGEIDAGPFLKEGTLAIFAGPKRTTTTFSFASLGMLPPNLMQTIETDPSLGCGSAGPLALEPLQDSLYPSVVAISIAIGKGCAPIPHVFVPVDDRSDRYAHAIAYVLDHQPRYPRGVRVIPPISTGGLRVKRVRDIVLPRPPGTTDASERTWTIEIVDGTDLAGAPLTIALDRPDPRARPDIGETLAIFARGPASGWVVRLSSEHEGRYRTLTATPSPGPTST